MPRILQYADRRGLEPVVAYLEGLSRAGESSVLATIERLLELLRDEGPAIRMPYARMIDRQERLYELRAGDHRVAYAQVGDDIVLLHAWRKRTQRLDRREAERAIPSRGREGATQCVTHSST